MREGLVVQAGPSPLANAFSEFTRAMYSGPSREERMYRQAMADKARMDMQQEQMQQAAQAEAIKAIPDLFKAQQVQAPDPNAVGPFQPGMQPMIARAETPEERVNRALPQAATLGLKMGGPGADGVKTMAQLMSAFLTQGSPDQARQGAMLDGRMPTPEFAPTGAEGDRISKRASDLKIAEEAAKPMSEGEWKAQQLAKNFDNLGKLDPYQQEALGALPKSGMSVSYDDQGRPVITMGGAAGQKAASVEKAKGDVVTLSQQANDLVDWLSANGGMMDENSDVASRAASVLQTAPIPGNEMAQRVIAPAIQTKRDELDGLRSLMLQTYRAAANIPAGMSNSDVEQKILGNALPQAGLSKQANKARIANFVKLYGTLKPAGQPAIAPSPAAPSAAPSAPASGGTNPQAAAAIEAARAAIANGKSREHVLQRLRQNGIEPPPDM